MEKNEPSDSTSIKPKRIYHTSRLSTPQPVIDGKLDDACWKTGEWAGDFIQWVPNEGARASQKTELKIFYDDKNIYVAIRAYDNQPEKMIRKLGKRDELNGDVVGITFDSYHDYRTGFEFDLTSAGQKVDALITNPSNADMNWNAVWYAKTGIEDSAWTAEFEIPLSQLRYSGAAEQVWGMHCWRWIDRFQEESDWEPETSTGPGMLYLFGELHGIEGIPPSRRIEIMPYLVGKVKTFQQDAHNPFTKDGRTWSGNAGVDAKIGLSTNFTADLTINPDFGQVESDPSVMNLTAFETFYDEHRPFFLEGKNIFSFNIDNNSLFYSRRIGHSPSYALSLSDQEHASYPDQTAILGAAKISGKTASGFSLGILQSVTASEYAQVDSAGARKDINVEPLTNYTIIRLQQDYHEGTTTLGGMFTSTNRFINNPQLEFLNRNAYTGGVDLYHLWNDKEYYLDAKFIGSYITGSSNAMTQLQNSSARYYQRTDVDYVHFDSSRTDLSGYGGKIKIGKGSKGLWRYSTELGWRSPGLDLNDVGYMQLADVITQANAISYFVNQPQSIFRTYTIGFTEENDWDFGWRHTSSGGTLNVYLEFLNNWAFSSATNYTTQTLDTRLLRGGSALYLPASWTESVFMRTDPSNILVFDVSATGTSVENNSRRYFSVQPDISIMPVPTLKFTVSMNYSTNVDRMQYVDTKTVNGDYRYILGTLDQHTLGATIRVDYNITPELSIQYYGSPFASVGKYSEFKRVTNPQAANYNGRFTIIQPIVSGDSCIATEQAASSNNYAFVNPDFNFSQFRSNLVFRWEYQPGSQLYFVWSQDRSDYTQPATQSISNVFTGLRNKYPNNVFLLKVNYWFSL